MASPSPQQILQEVFGYNQFRHQQQAIVEHVIAGDDALVLMPTGGEFYNLLKLVDYLLGSKFRVQDEIGQPNKNSLKSKSVDALGLEVSFSSTLIYPISSNLP